MSDSSLGDKGKVSIFLMHCLAACVFSRADIQLWMLFGFSSFSSEVGVGGKQTDEGQQEGVCALPASLP